MWQCRKCSKPVYFAERKQSLGFDWHPNCLRCEECGKRLNPGQHAEHKGVPFCHHPCYGALFGPQLFGHGTRNECHTSFGKVQNRDGQIKRSHLESRLKIYNSIYEGKPGELKSREANGRLVLEGVLRIYWGVNHIIHLKEEDDSRMIATRRQISMPSRLNVPCFSDSEEEVENTLWRDDSPNRMTEITSSGDSGLQIPNVGESEPQISEYDNNGWNSQFSTSKQEELLSSSDCDVSQIPSVNSNNVLSYVDSGDNSMEPLISSDCTNENKEHDLYSNQDNTDNSEFQTAVLSFNSEYLTPLCTEVGHNLSAESHLLDVQHDYSDTLDTLTSSFSDQFGTLTCTSKLDSHVGLLSNETNLSEKSLLNSSSIDYSLSKDKLDPQSPSDDSSPYSDSSDPLTSFTDTSEPQTPLSDNPGSQLNFCRNQSSSLKLIKNTSNQFRRQTSLDSVASTLPLLCNESIINGDFMKLSKRSQSPNASYHSVDSHLNSSLYNDSPDRIHKNGSTAIRRRPGRRMNKSRLKRRCSINGHYYLRETSSFTPPYGSPCSIWITSKTTAEEVLNMLLEKYKVEMSTFNFALFVVKDSGELRRIREDESPLVTRVMLGPHEDVAKVFIMDAQRTQEVSHEVAQFLNLSLAECRAILAKYEQEEMKQVKAIKKRYDDMRFFIQKRIVELRSL